MTALQFIAAVIGSLAWPAALVTFLIIFRSPIRKILERFRSGKAFGVELTIGERADEILSSVRIGNRLDHDPAGIEPTRTDAEPFLALIERSPSDAVIASWQQVRHASEELARREGIP